LVHRHARLDPADQLIAPEAEQLPHRRQPRDRGAGEGLQTVLQELEGVALQVVLAAIAPLAQAAFAAAGEGPERIGHHEAPAAEALATLDRLEQHAVVALGAHLQPGGERGFQIRRPALPEGDEGVAGSQLQLKMRALLQLHYDDVSRRALPVKPEATNWLAKALLAHETFT